MEEWVNFECLLLNWINHIRSRWKDPNTHHRSSCNRAMVNWRRRHQHWRQQQQTNNSDSNSLASSPAVTTMIELLLLRGCRNSTNPISMYALLKSPATTNLPLAEPLWSNWRSTSINPLLQSSLHLCSGYEIIRVQTSMTISWQSTSSPKKCLDNFSDFLLILARVWITSRCCGSTRLYI